MYTVTCSFILVQTGALTHTRGFVSADYFVQRREFSRRLEELGARNVSWQLFEAKQNAQEVRGDADLQALAKQVVDEILAEHAEHVAWLADWRARAGRDSFSRKFDLFR